MPHPEYVYKIADAAGFAEAERAGTFTGMPIDVQDGYIHLSTAGQLAETLGLHFRGQKGLVLLALRAADFGETLVWEPSRGGALFPHLYGTFPISAIAWRGTVDVGADGSVVLPPEVR